MKFVAAVFLVATAIVGAGTYANTKPESFEQYALKQCNSASVGELAQHAACVQRAIDTWFTK
jgi:hypothetical protein